jgi:hypothetical protein
VAAAVDLRFYGLTTPRHDGKLSLSLPDLNELQHEWDLDTPVGRGDERAGGGRAPRCAGCGVGGGEERACLVWMVKLEGNALDAIRVLVRLRTGGEYDARCLLGKIAASTSSGTTVVEGYMRALLAPHRLSSCKTHAPTLSLEALSHPRLFYETCTGLLSAYSSSSFSHPLFPSLLLPPLVPILRGRLQTLVLGRASACAEQRAHGRRSRTRVYRRRTGRVFVPARAKRGRVEGVRGRAGRSARLDWFPAISGCASCGRTRVGEAKSTPRRTPRSKVPIQLCRVALSQVFRTTAF